jgi:hypothetical protein
MVRCAFLLTLKYISTLRLIEFSRELSFRSHKKNGLVPVNHSKIFLNFLLGPRKLANFYENRMGFEKNNLKNSFCFKQSEILTLTESDIVNV